jgi:hypothetical protein
MIEANHFQNFWWSSRQRLNLYLKIAHFLKFNNLPTLSVQQITRNVISHPHNYLPDGTIACRQLNNADYFETHAFAGLDISQASAVGTISKHTALQAWSNALARHFDQPKR